MPAVLAAQHLVEGVLFCKANSCPASTVDFCELLKKLTGTSRDYSKYTLSKGFLIKAFPRMKEIWQSWVEKSCHGLKTESDLIGRGK